MRDALLAYMNNQARQPMPCLVCGSGSHTRNECPLRPQPRRYRGREGKRRDGFVVPQAYLDHRQVADVAGQYIPGFGQFVVDGEDTGEVVGHFEGPVLTVLGLGGGVQSTTMLLMAEEGAFGRRPDMAIFADTGRERTPTYEHLRWLIERPGGIPVIVRRREERDIAQHQLGGLYGQRFANMPFHTLDAEGHGGVLPRKCTKEFKTEVMRGAIREALGVAPRKQVRQMVVQWLGISLDEVQRMRDSDVGWLQFEYPLIEQRISRNGCQIWLAAQGYPSPGKSSCIECPFHTNAYWSLLRDEDPMAFAEAVAFDEQIRRGLKGASHDCYLHFSRRPLRELTFANSHKRQAQTTLDDFAAVCGAECGV